MPIFRIKFRGSDLDDRKKVYLETKTNVESLFSALLSLLWVCVISPGIWAFLSRLRQKLLDSEGFFGPKTGRKRGEREALGIINGKVGTIRLTKLDSTLN